jgi:predicted O-methyltransferase YrrM
VWLLREIARATLPRAVALGGTVILACLLVGVGGDAASALGITTTALAHVVMAGRRAIERESRNAADAVGIPVLSEHYAPPLGDWAIDADFAQLIGRELRADTVAVELGSGTSTLIIAAALRAEGGSGRVIAIEHERQFAAETSKRLERGKLDRWAEVAVVPVRQQTIGRSRVGWYDTGALLALIPERVDVIVVDGPPAVARWSRWPAVPVLEGRLSVGGVVLADDGRKRNLRRTAMRWRREHRDMDLFWHDTVKGAWKLVKRAEPRREDWTRASARAILRVVNPCPAGFGRGAMQR